MVMAGKVPPTEVTPKAKRRVFSAEYKQRILREVDSFTEPGQLAALLRREGLYSSHLSEWRKLRQQLGEAAMAATKRGPAPKQRDERDRKIEELERALAKANARAERAEVLVELQKKVAELLGRSIDLGSEKP
jgi:transposase-like protein